MDVTCRKCGEPWDYYGAMDGDMEPEEWTRFKRGEGCPCCGFGTICTQCDGSGKEPQDRYASAHECPVCMGRRIVRVRRAPHSPNPRFHRWAYGYTPNMVIVPDNVVAERHLRPERSYLSADAPVEERSIRCPECWDEAPPCAWCGGTGAPPAKTEDEDSDATIAFLASLVDVCEGDEVFEAVDALEREARAPATIPTVPTATESEVTSTT